MSVQYFVFDFQSDHYYSATPRKFEAKFAADISNLRRYFDFAKSRYVQYTNNEENKKPKMITRN